ncbi:MAG: TonB-dependent receptor plug domain-containing protein [Campylobacterales bacterium]
MFRRSAWLLLLSFGLLRAEESPEASLLLDALEETSTLATRTKLNIDDLPSTITVLHRDQLSRMGFLTLHDALSILPGVDSTRSSNGWRMATMRGAYVANSFGFDKVKLLIDGVDVTTALYGSVYYYLDFPVDLIERIEVLRGPASVEYGTGAYAGAINVVTRLQEGGENQLFLQGGNEAYRGAGAVLNHRIGNWRVGMDAYRRQDRATVEYPDPDRGGHSAWGGTSFQGFTDQSAGVLITDERFYLKGRTKQAAYDNHTGGIVTPVADNGPKNNNTHHLLEAGYRSDFHGGFRWQVKTGVREYTYDMQMHAYSPDQVKTILLGDLDDFEEIGEDYIAELMGAGLDLATATARWENSALPALNAALEANLTHYGIGDFYGKERSHYAELRGEFQTDRLLIELGGGFEENVNLGSHVRSNYLDSEIESTIVAVLENDAADLLGQPTDPIDADWGAPKTLVDDQGFVGSKTHRRQIASIWAKTSLQLSDALDLSLGARSDRYSDLNKALPSYQAGLLYRAGVADRFKLMAGHAFRAPSRVELYSLGARGLIPLGDPGLKPETVDTVQIGWHRRMGAQDSMETTLFHSTLRDVLDINSHDAFNDGTDTDTYANFPKRTASGMEFGWQAYTTPEHRFQGSLAYLNVRHHGIAAGYNDDMPRMQDIASLLGNIAHTWYLSGRWSLNTHAQLQAGRIQNHSNLPIDDNIVVNETLTWQMSPDIRWRIYAYNLFDATQKMPSTWGYHAQGIVTAGRRIYLSYTQRF